jgi:hypothetical protein
MKLLASRTSCFTRERERRMNLDLASCSDMDVLLSQYFRHFLPRKWSAIRIGYFAIGISALAAASFLIFSQRLNGGMQRLVFAHRASYVPLN